MFRLRVGSWISTFSSWIDLEPAAVEIDRQLEPLAIPQTRDESLNHWIFAFSPSVTALVIEEVVPGWAHVHALLNGTALLST